jgi:Tfp pilus assembly protein PilO
MVPILSYPKLLGIIAILASCYGAYYYVSNIQKSLEEYKTKTIQLEQTVDNYKNQIRKAVEIQKTLNVELQETRNQTRLLEKKLEENNLKDITTKKTVFS